MKRIFALMIVLALLAGCSVRTGDPLQPAGTEAPPQPEEPAEERSEEAMDDTDGEEADLSADEATAVTDFGLELFRACLTGENTLVSPLSVLEALAMTANGADGETLAQMEEVFGLPMQTLNDWLLAYHQALGEGTELANGIWFNDGAGIEVKEAFLQTNADYYDAAIQRAPFDADTVDTINAWVAEHTADRIDSIIDELDPYAVMVLVNALAFDGTWETIYREDQVQDGTFATESGEERDVPLMQSTEHTFLQDDNATGFVKYYNGRDYAFVALLPNEGVSVADYAAGLTGQAVQDMLAGAEGATVNAAIPKFSARYGAELSGVLAGMGMADAFDPAAADFSRIAEGALHISQVLHKTFISVDEKGTEAGAATAVVVREASAMPSEEIMTVWLDRPFVYMLIDCEQNVPLFIGAVTDIG